VNVSKSKSNNPIPGNAKNEDALMIEDFSQINSNTLLPDDLIPAKRRQTGVIPNYKYSLQLVPETSVQGRNTSLNDLNMTNEDSESSKMSQFYDQE